MTISMPRLKNALRALLPLLAIAATAAARAEETYSFAVVPQFSQRKSISIWKPIIDRVARRTGLRLTLTATQTIPEYEAELSKGSFDFTYANPYHILREARRQGYIPLVRDNVPIVGVLVVAKDGPVRGIAELDGKTLAVPSPNAVGAALQMRADLEWIYHVRMNLLNVKTHTSVYLHVVNGLADAGGGVQKTLAEQEEPIRNALRVIHTTQAIPSHPVAVHPRVPKAAAEAVRKALLELAATPEGQALFAEVPMTQPVAASIDDYLVMQDWGLERYWIEEGK